MSNRNRFDYKVVIVTGAAGGIGEDTAVKFAEEGAKVVLVDLSDEALEKVLENEVFHNENSLAVSADVSDEDSVKNYINQAIDKFGRIDILVNNAGVGGAIKFITDYPTDSFDQVIGVNLKGTFLGMKYALPHMVDQEGGVIVNLSSIGGLQGMPTTSAYVASKFGINGLTQTAALEYASENIRVNAVCPSPVNTEMMRKTEAASNPDHPEDAQAAYSEMIPLGRYAESEEVSSVILFLASEDAKFVTGSIVPVDGGMTA